MKKCFVVMFLMLFGLSLSVLPSVRLIAPVLAAAPASPATPPFLAISQMKITGDEFLVLKNNSGKDIPDLSIYWLNGFNSFSPLDAGVTSSSQQLPAVKLGNGQTILLSSNGMSTCGAAVVSKLSVSLGDSSGFLQIVQTSLSSLGVTQMPVDFVSWSSGANGQIQSVPTSTKDPRGMYYRYAGSSGYSWQLADLDATVPCQLNVVNSGTVSVGLAQADSSVPSVVGVGGTAGVSAGLPDDDVGLAAPQISEVLPNPASPQTDDNDEFIELYNSNTQPFDLSGFVLQVGMSTTHKYTFPAGTAIQPQQFSAFYSSDTGLSLSNTSGQVKLLDPGGNVLEQSDVYPAAKDGYAWVYANGLWQWTTKATPGAKNIITSPPAAKTSAKSTTKPAVLGAHTSTPSSSGSSGNFSSAPTPSKVHPLILAGIGTLAVLYALYEYRHDLANTLYRFRRYRAARRATEQTAGAASGFRTLL